MRNTKVAFLDFQMQVKFLHPLKDPFGVFGVEGGVGGGDEQVIHVDDVPSFSDHVSEQIVHETLKGGWGVAKTKEHDGWLK